MSKTELIHFDWNSRKYAKQLITDRETLLHAFGEFGRALLVVDDSFSGQLWTYGQEYGVIAVIRADSFQSALEAVYDELPTVPTDELYEAYGFDTEEEFQALVASSREKDGVTTIEIEYPNLAEGYSYQANSSGTGIVNHGHSESLQELDSETLEAFKISLVIELDDDDED